MIVDPEKVEKVKFSFFKGAVCIMPFLNTEWNAKKTVQKKKFHNGMEQGRELICNKMEKGYFRMRFRLSGFPLPSKPTLQVWFRSVCRLKRSMWKDEHSLVIVHFSFAYMQST